MKCIVTACTLALLIAGAAHAQTLDQLNIDIEGRVVNVTGGERPNTSASTGGLVIGRTTHAAFSKSAVMCGFGVSGATSLQSDAVGGWLVDVTPHRVDGNAVTFRVHWTRGRDSQQSATLAADLELTLRPGESVPLDIVPLSPSVTMPYQQCGVRATVLRVSVNYWPRPELDARLTSTDLWLVERMPDGSEHAQMLTVRGQFGRPTSFYFEPLADGVAKLDFYGEFTLTTNGGNLGLGITVRSRFIDNSGITAVLHDSPNSGRARAVDKTLTLTPGEVVGLELPRLGENESGAFSGRSYSIRIRTRQIR